MDVEEAGEAVVDGGKDGGVDPVGIGSEELDMVYGCVAVDFKRQHGDMGTENIIEFKGIVTLGLGAFEAEAVKEGGGLVGEHAVLFQQAEFQGEGPEPMKGDGPADGAEQGMVAAGAVDLGHHPGIFVEPKQVPARGVEIADRG